jgi:PAS domain S-box-containing protein
VLDRRGDARVDRIVAMAAAHFETPIALVSLVDAERQWFKSCIGLDARETPRGWAFCRHTIQLGGHAVMLLEDATADERFVDNPLVTGPPNIRFYAGATLTTRDGRNLGTLCVVDVKPRRTLDEADLGHLRALADLVVDQIELSQARKDLEDRHRILDLAERMSGMGYWTLNTQTGSVFWSPQVYAIHGVDPRSYDPGIDDALGFYIEQDREMVGNLIQSQSDKGEGWEFDATVVRPDGSRRSVRSLAECQRDPSGRVTGFFGVFKDLTDERLVIADAVEKERRYRLLADNVSDVIAVYGIDGTFSYLSPSIKELLGYAPEELIGRTTYSIIDPDDHARVAAEFENAAGSEKPTTVEYRALTKEGTKRWLEARPRFQRDPEGRIIEITDSVRDVTERKEREAALAHARVAAEAAVRTKTEFLTNMSHEIRTPLNGVLGFAEVLANTRLDADQMQYVNRIRTAGTGLSALIDDILDFSKIESGKMTVERRPFDLRALATDVVDLTRIGLSGRLALEIDFDDAVSDWIVGDEQRTRQVLLNLLGNAAKFTQSGSVRLVVRRGDDTLQIKVIDTGIGISPNAMARLFRDFTQGDSSVGRRFGGSGLGLSISRALAQLMSGDVTLESVPDIGTTAMLTLPYRAAAATTARVRSRPRAQPAARPLRILVVDDVSTNLELLDILLSAEGHSVTCALSGGAAIETLALDAGFDLILMDIQMPGMDGLATTRLIRAMPGMARTPVVALTAHVLPEQVEDCRAAGMDDHLAKPIKQDALLELVSRVARIAGAQTPDARDESSEDDPLAGLKTRYRAQMNLFEAEFARLEALPPDRRADAIATYTHSIAGTAGSLGFPEVSRAAAQLEAAAKLCGDAGDVRERLHPLIARLLATVACEGRLQGRSKTSIPEAETHTRRHCGS